MSHGSNTLEGWFGVDIVHGSIVKCFEEDVFIDNSSCCHVVWFVVTAVSGVVVTAVSRVVLSWLAFVVVIGHAIVGNGGSFVLRTQFRMRLAAFHFIVPPDSASGTFLSLLLIVVVAGAKNAAGFVLIESAAGAKIWLREVAGLECEQLGDHVVQVIEFVVNITKQVILSRKVLVHWMASEPANDFADHHCAVTISARFKYVLLSIFDCIDVILG